MQVQGYRQFPTLKQEELLFYRDNGWVQPGLLLVHSCLSLWWWFYLAQNAPKALLVKPSFSPVWQHSTFTERAWLLPPGCAALCREGNALGSVQFTSLPCHKLILFGTGAVPSPLPSFPHPPDLPANFQVYLFQLHIQNKKKMYQASKQTVPATVWCNNCV